MKNRVFAFVLFAILFTSCVKEPLAPAIPSADAVSLYVQTKESQEVLTTKSNAYENDMNDIYLLVFDELTDAYVECQPATLISDSRYSSPLTPRASGVRIVAVANQGELVRNLMGGWSSSSSYKTVTQSLLTSSLPTVDKAIRAQPEVPPLSAELTVGEIKKSMTISSPFVLERATAKITLSVSAPDFDLLGANLYNVPTQGYVVANQPFANQLALSRGNYVGPDGIGGYDSRHMISKGTATDPLYCYETALHTDPLKHPYLIVHSSRGYYRINLTDKQGEQIVLQRNYYYKIHIAHVATDGSATPEEAENELPLNADVTVNDPDSHEIMSNGIDYLGLSNSEYILYVSSVINEFNYYAFGVWFGGLDYNTFNGFLAATLTYKSRSEGSVTCIECVTESKGTQASGIQFRDANVGVWKPTSWDEMQKWKTIVSELVLPRSVNRAVSKMINIVIPFDFVSGKLKVQVGSLERIITIKRNAIISHMGDVINMGKGYATANVDFEKDFLPAKASNDVFPLITVYDTKDLVSFSNSEHGGYSKSLVINNASDDLFVKVNSPFSDDQELFIPYSTYRSTCSEFYLTKEADQSRTKVHLVREPFLDGAKDAQSVGSPHENYSMAFWRSAQKGERIVRVPRLNETQYWSARVLYGEDFIRLAHVDPQRTSGLGESGTTGDAEDYWANDDTWKSYLEQKYFVGFDNVHYPMFRIALKSVNPNPDKPRYGLVAFMCPYSRGGVGIGQTFLIFVRQGEEADYVFSPSEAYNGSLRQFAQRFSPYLLTVPNPADHLGGPNYADHKSMNGRGVFANYPNDLGYLYRYGDDIAFHPTNPNISTAINGYTYDFSKPYQEICPEGYSLPKTDAVGIAFDHSFTHSTWQYSRRGLCADGYLDRQPVASARTNEGIIYYNAATLSSIFFPTLAKRVESPPAGQAWATIENWTGDVDSQGVLGGVPVKRDRLLPVRCVKVN